ncbi:MAG: UMP kinase [Candidatus Gracilibacteria bacterium]|nr:UMP kinase [Candidatus Gracilibacteria bacterium]
MRVLLKISGEALKGEKDFGIDPSFVEDVVMKVKEIKENNIELAIVVGGGNIYRGSNLISSGVNPTDSHNLSMLSTVFNGVVLKNFLDKACIKSIVMDPNGINFVEVYNKNTAKKYLKKGYIVICTGGTGNPYFTTDTGGVLRSLELECNMIIKATKVDGIYSKDPMKHKDAKFYEKVTYDDVIGHDLKIMDHTAISLAKESNQVIKVVNLSKKGAILKAILGEKEGSTICA